AISAQFASSVSRKIQSAATVPLSRWPKISNVGSGTNRFRRDTPEFLREEGNGSGAIQQVHSSWRLWLVWRRPLAGSLGKANLSGSRQQLESQFCRLKIWASRKNRPPLPMVCRTTF